MESRLQTQALPIDDLVESVRLGHIRIPSFQRGLRWGRTDVIKLFDSIVRGYPIGNLLLWKRKASAVSHLRIGALDIDAQETDAALFVVDGQQRLTSLANALTDEGHRDQKFALSYDVEKQMFVPRTDRSVYEIPLPIIFDLSRLLSLYSEQRALLENPEYVKRANDVAKAIREFRVPVYVVEQSDADVLRDIFDRMNNYGKQLSRAEVFSALHEAGGGENSDGTSANRFAGIAAEIHAISGFGVIDEDTILLATLARRGPDVSRDIRREFATDSTLYREFPEESAEQAMRGTLDAMLRAVRFLQRDAAIPHFAFLTYRFLMVALTRFFAHFPDPTAAEIRNLRRWFWRAASLGADFSKGNLTQATRALCARIVPGRLDETMRGLRKAIGDEPGSLPAVGEFRTNWANTRLMMSAMWSLHPRSLEAQHEMYSLDDLTQAIGESATAVQQAPQISTRAFADVSLRLLPGNRVLLAVPEAMAPESVLERLRRVAERASAGDDVAAATLASHGITESTAPLLLGDHLDDFVRSRDRDLAEVLRVFISRMAEWQYEDTPALSTLVVEDLRDDMLA